MNVTREDMPGRQVALTIDLDPEMVNSALEKAYRQMVNQVNVPGFRRGKAPRYVLERYVGKEMLTERAVKNILPQTLQDAITEQNIEAMDVGEVEIVNMDPLQVKIVVVQPPKVELGDYGSIRVEKEPVEVKPEQVEEVILELRREGAPWNEPSEPRPIGDGDMVYLDLEGFTTEGELEEAKRENFPTIVGMPRAGVPEAVNQQLSGMNLGEEKDVVGTLPEDYPTEALRGRDVTYHVTVRSMKEQQLPELNDELAKSVGGYESVDALREAVETNLRQRSEEASESGQVNTAIEQLVKGSTAEVPEMMVNEELDGMLKRLEERLKEQRINLRQYFTYNGMTEPEWREANRERARERVINAQVLQEFARREGIAVDDAEIDSEINGILEKFEGTEKEQAQAVLGSDEARHDVEDRLFQRKLLERLVGIAEGRIEAAPAPAGEDAERADAGEAGEATAQVQSEVSDTQTAEAQINTEAAEAESNAASASDLEEAGGAAEVLGTEGVDLRSPNETGDASGGGTPASAPGLESTES